MILAPLRSTGAPSPGPQGERSEADERFRESFLASHVSRFSRSEKKQLGGLGGAVSPPPPNRVGGGAPENFGFSLFEWPNFVSPGDL